MTATISPPYSNCLGRWQWCHGNSSTCTKFCSCFSFFSCSTMLLLLPPNCGSSVFPPSNRVATLILASSGLVLLGFPCRVWSFAQDYVLLFLVAV
ncbi:hypothetical protein O6P43_032088 [Quillaja saponaria]|uniref:Uncharacterized protein n=1 Tax=Quillaja saponaria TaxID=32244 RepID=A0AAD7KX78_QUISA|nr:hypothetical protein O6P43_032002 [Quillaja saponaria]KAJ7947258.1 hypothetical protein O6P43_032088 [Quillaja saponaria]